jgi:hypothetical protein
VSTALAIIGVVWLIGWWVFLVVFSITIWREYDAK